MYATADAVQVGTCADLWRQGRYRVQLTAELTSYLEDIDAGLERLGYRMVDADQRGRSYQRGANSHDTGKLDETEYEFGPVRLVLSRGDLEATQTDAAEEEMIALYEGLSRTMRSYDAEPLPAGSDRIQDHRYSILDGVDLQEEV
jgi:hypothetical protein